MTPVLARLIRGVVFFWCSCVFLTSCAPEAKTAVPPLPAPSEKTIIGAGDVFTLDIVGEKDLPREYQVASDGTVDLPYVHTLTVEGLEPQEIAELIRQRLMDAKILTDPSVIVQVKEYNSRRVIVLGQVAKPGTFPLTAGLTLLQVISSAGGLTAIANDDHVTLTRKVGKGRTQTVNVSVDDITSGRAQDIPLQAGDRVYVYERIF
jgi:protein involved in polysaccharide export with SLBB domain